MQLQFPMMETDSGVDDGNHCMVYIVLPYLHTSEKNFLLSSLTTCTPLPDNYLHLLQVYEVAVSPNIMIALLS